MIRHFIVVYYSFLLVCLLMVQHILFCKTCFCLAITFIYNRHRMRHIDLIKQTILYCLFIIILYLVIIVVMVILSLSIFFLSFWFLICIMFLLIIHIRWTKLLCLILVLIMIQLSMLYRNLINITVQLILMFLFCRWIYFSTKFTYILHFVAVI